MLPAALAEDISHKAHQADEIAGVLLCSVVHAASRDIRLLGREMIWLEPSAYDKKGPYGLVLNAEGYTRPLAVADSLNATPIWVHTHPGLGASPNPSEHDVIVDQGIADVFRLRSGSPYYGALIFSPRANGLAFTGHLDVAERAINLDRLWIVGSRLQLSTAYGSKNALNAAAFDRNIRAFGGDLQHALSELHVGIVGTGGTGSAVAEQLVRLGVRRLMLVDPDFLSASNVTRVYGSTPLDVGRPKVEVVADHLLRIAPDIQCERVISTINTERSAKQLTACDIIFGCTDDNAGRLILSRIPTYLLTPVIDCGVLLSSEDDRLTGIDGRVTSLIPGDACLLCHNRIDLARAAAELLTPEERSRREDEGYAPALGRQEPAVVAFTTMVAATAVSELLERFIGYGPEPRPNEVLLRCHEREISTNIASPREGHYCNAASRKMGIGSSDPFLGLTWPT